MKLFKCIEYIQSDFYRITEKRSSFVKMWLYTFMDSGFRFMFWFRLAQWSSVFSIMPKIKYRLVGQRLHIDIERCTQIGFGFRILHGGPLVINSSAIIGNNVNICQNTTIGSLCHKAAHIGNNVYIGPSVCIVENVNIGDNATIGAGAVVVKDVPKDSTVAGNPAKVISMKTPARFIWRKWQPSEK